MPPTNTIIRFTFPPLVSSGSCRIIRQNTGLRNTRIQLACPKNKNDNSLPGLPLNPCGANIVASSQFWASFLKNQYFRYRPGQTSSLKKLFSYFKFIVPSDSHAINNIIIRSTLPPLAGGWGGGGGGERAKIHHSK